MKWKKCVFRQLHVSFKSTEIGSRMDFLGVFIDDLFVAYHHKNHTHNHMLYVLLRHTARIFEPYTNLELKILDNDLSIYL